ncbi:MAG: flavin reductase family protein [Chitinophagaceae bacterium]
MNEKLVVLIGGGSGITPLYSILKTLLKSSNATIILFNCNRTWDDVVFLQGITYLEQEYSDRLQTFHFLSRETGNTDTGCKHIRREKLSKLVLRKLVKKLLAERVCEAEYFLCGPYGLTSLAIDVLESLEIPQTHIHIEHFVPIENGSAIFELPQTNKEVMLQYSEQKKLLVVHPSKSILEAALESGIYLRHSCKSGTCGKCVAKQKSGKLHMMQNYALTEEELNQGYVLLCQSHPLDDKVTIVIE